MLKTAEKLLWLYLIIACLQGCGSKVASPDEQLFSLLPGKQTGITFRNDIEYTEDYNPYTFRNFFNGGGVGIGDINNDGLPDVFFCANMRSNKLYLNKGNLQFEDITEKAGLATEDVWSSGVAMADVNGDGWLDIYVCKSGKPEGKRRNNELFINNKNGTFSEKAREYGLADLGLSTHAAFFDYDRDGDLDCYLLNNSTRPVGNYDLRKDQRKIRDPEGGNKLYRNDGQKFTDVSEAAGIYGSSIGFGLGVTVGDVNRDGWPDLYVSNDFFEKDYLYLNQQNGTFKEVLEAQIQEISFSSMGADMADLNNDGYPEIFVTDMLPESDDRMKTKTAFEDWNKYHSNLKNGYYRQFNRNVLQLNNGNGTFSEIGRMAGVHATDWSWGALICDLDNNGQKDIFVANGLLRDLNDQDYINFYSDPSQVQALMKKQKGVITKMVDAMPSQAIPNYAFANLGNLDFANKAAEWGLGQPSFSNGSAYGDLDQDGDLDLVVNNINAEAFVYRNNAETFAKNQANYLSLNLEGEEKNPFAIGSQVMLKAQGQVFFQELFPMRGFESSVDYRLTFGLGKIQKIDSLIVNWPNGKCSKLANVKINQKLTLKQSAAREAVQTLAVGTNNGIFVPQKNTDLQFSHRENEYSDFDRERLIFQMYSAEGPRLVTGDVNGDGREDVFIGGAAGQAGMIFVQNGNGFNPTKQAALEADQACEDTDAVFFDADGDRDLDLYVCSGGSEFGSNSTELMDRLYLNDGRGQFSRSNQPLPTFQFENSACVAAGDFDGDGDQDLFVGIRGQAAQYGIPANGYLLQNDGKGHFTEKSAQFAPAMKTFGRFTDAEWLDVDRDRDLDLVTVGEWLPLTIWRNEKGQLKPENLPKSEGFWNVVKAADLDGDGDQDLVLGNLGLNHRIYASPEKPAELIVGDFDANGSMDPFFCINMDGRMCPIALLPDVLKQVPGLRKTYIKHSDYQGKSIEDVLGSGVRKTNLYGRVFSTQSALGINNGKGIFALQNLPKAAQMAPVYGILTQDFDRDGKTDLLLGGNFHYGKPETGSYAASYGLFLKGSGKGNFQVVPAKESGFSVDGQIRDLKTLNVAGKKWILAARNNASLEVVVAH